MFSYLKDDLQPELPENFN